MTDAKTEAAGRESKWQGMTLAEYVQHRNGVPLGHADSLKNMLYRSLGAGTFAEFWRYWNPIWGYALGRYIYAPLRRLLPAALAVILTFVVSGAIHDAVIMLIRRDVAFLFTPWFLFMSIIVVAGQALNINYGQRSWASRVVINLIYILGCLVIALLVF